MRPALCLNAMAATAVVAALSACANYPGAAQTGTYPATYPATTSYPTAPAYVQYGRVTSIELLRTQQPGTASGAGAVVGGVVGGILGHQVGKGTGRDVATVAGAIGGALVGNTIEKSNMPANVSEIHRVSVQLDNGTMRAFDYASPPNVRIGDRVRVENDQLYR